MPTCRLRRTARCWPGWRAWQSGWTPGRPWRCETEVSLADQLERFRKEHGRGAYRGASFPTISAFGANAAIVHYEPQAKSAHDANPEKLYLVDSGGQYENGTTDVTRTVSFKEHPGEFEREAYTRVLKGVI